MSQCDNCGPPLRRVMSIFVTDQILDDAYQSLLEEDPGVAAEAVAAYLEMESVPYDGLDNSAKKASPDGVVQRRAPKNPLVRLGRPSLI